MTSPSPIAPSHGAASEHAQSPSIVLVGQSQPVLALFEALRPQTDRRLVVVSSEPPGGSHGDVAADWCTATGADSTEVATQVRDALTATDIELLVLVQAAYPSAPLTLGAPDSAAHLADVMLSQFLYPVWVLNAVLPRMLERGTGGIVGVCQFGSSSRSPKAAVSRTYGTALATYLESLRPPLGMRGISVSVLRVSPQSSLGMGYGAADVEGRCAQTVAQRLMGLRIKPVLDSMLSY